MSRKLAKFRSFELWLTTPRREVVRSQVVPCNDNRPGLVRAGGQDRRPRQGPAGQLACHWSLSRDGRLACRWQLLTDGRACGSQDRPAPAADPPRVSISDPTNVLEVVGG
jgi:hypothetical protein